MDENSYESRFSLVDEYVSHLDAALLAIDDPYVASRYVGSVAVSAYTVYELAIRDIFVSFCQKKHAVFGTFAESYFARINGRISSGDIVSRHITKFGEKYVNRFRRRRDEAERQFLKSHGVSVLSSYGNVITWRNQFAHEGTIPSTATFEEVKKSYDFGKHLVHCLAKTMVR